MREIRAIMDARLSGLAEAEQVPVAWENVDFDPPEGGVYWRSFLLPGDPSAVGLGTAAENFHVGVYQVDVVAPAGSGWGVASESAAKVISLFKRGTDMTGSNIHLRVTSAQPGPGLREGARFKIPVSIFYRAVIPNE